MWEFQLQLQTKQRRKGENKTHNRGRPNQLPRRHWNAVDTTLFKIILNSIILTKGARCMTVDLKGFYLNTPMKRLEYMHLKLSNIPEEIIEQYNLREITTPEGYIYTEITKGMYGLPQAGIITQVLLEERLDKYGYSQSKNKSQDHGPMPQDPSISVSLSMTLQ